MVVRLPVRIDRSDDGEVSKLLLVEEWYDVLEPVYRMARDSVKYADLASISLPNVGELLENLVGTVGAGAILLFLNTLNIVMLAAERAISLVKFRWQNAGKSGKGKSGHRKSGGGPIYVEEV